MFFAERIISIAPNMRVLEVGPGANPHPRSNVLLEKSFTREELLKQNGNSGILETDKKIVQYDGDIFPFQDNEFDYVICSHVLEHINSDKIELFVSELSRVAPMGYLEFPTIYYDFIYGFDVHITFLNFKNGILRYMSKEESGLNKFIAVQDFFRQTLSNGHHSLVNLHQRYFFQGFEWNHKIQVEKVSSIDLLVVENNELSLMPVLKKEEEPKIDNSYKNSLRALLKKVFIK